MAVEITLILFGCMCLLLVLGIHIALTLFLVSLAGFYLMMGSLDTALSIISSTALQAVRDYVFAVVPLFVLMGELAARSGAAGDLFSVANQVLRRLPGRLAVATVFGNTLFAAVTGVSVASAAAFSRIAYPAMQSFGYGKRFALGSIAGSACLGMLIPPSVLMIVWAVLTELSIGKLFVGGILPGLVLALLFSIYAVLRAKWDPAAAPTERDSAVPMGASRDEWIGAGGVLILVMLVLGGIWGGFFTPTEAAGVGAIGALVLGIAKGMRLRALMQALLNSALITAPIMFLIITAQMYSRFLAFGGVIDQFQNAVTSFSDHGWTAIAMMTVIWLVLGMVLDSTSIILLTVPIFAPIAANLGFDPILFAIYGILIIEAGLLSPPFGILVFVVKSAVPDDAVRLGDIFAGSFPYLIMLVLVALSLWAFPGLVLTFANMI